MVKYRIGIFWYGLPHPSSSARESVSSHFVLHFIFFGFKWDVKLNLACFCSKCLIIIIILPLPHHHHAPLPPSLPHHHHATVIYAGFRRRRSSRELEERVAPHCHTHTATLEHTLTHILEHCTLTHCNTGTHTGPLTYSWAGNRLLLISLRRLASPDDIPSLPLISIHSSAPQKNVPSCFS